MIYRSKFRCSRCGVRFSAVLNATTSRVTLVPAGCRTVLHPNRVELVCAICNALLGKVGIQLSFGMKWESLIADATRQLSKASET